MKPGWIAAAGLGLLIIGASLESGAPPPASSEPHTPEQVAPVKPDPNAVGPVAVENCRLGDASFDPGVHLGYDRPDYFVSSTGEPKVTVIFVDFDDAEADITPEEAFESLEPGLSEYYAAVSYGKLHLQVEPTLEWIRMPRDASEYDWDDDTSYESYITTSLRVADHLTDYENTEMVIIVAPPSATQFERDADLSTGRDLPWKVDEGYIENAATLTPALYSRVPYVAIHETGHGLGLPDLYWIAQPEEWPPTGDFGLMGLYGRAPENFAFERWVLDWIEDEQVTCFDAMDDPAAGQVTLTAVEIPGGKKAAIVRTGPYSLVVAESRRALGYDGGLIDEGVIVYTVDLSIESGMGPIIVHPLDEPARTNAPLGVGESLTVNGVTVTVIDSDGVTDTVGITASP